MGTSAGDRPTVIVTRRWPAACEARLRELFDARLNRKDRPMAPAALREALCDCDALLCTVTDPITAEVMDASPLRARVLGNFGVGFNHIDLEAARARGLVVTNTPGVLDDCTADLTMTLMLMLARRAGSGERQLRAGLWAGWRPTHLLGTRVSGKTLGIVGLGGVGRAVARRAAAGFGMRVLFVDPQPPPLEQQRALGVQRRENLNSMLVQSDFVSLHCPASSETHHLIGPRELAAMRPGAMLINTARGGLVDEDALVLALQQGQIAGVALDVHEAEPTVHEQLIGREDVVLLPHLGSATEETRVAMGMRVIDNLQAFFAGEPPPDRVA